MSTETKELTKDGVLKTLWAIKDDDKFYFDSYGSELLSEYAAQEVAKEMDKANKLIDALEFLMEGVGNLPPLTAIEGVLVPHYKKAKEAIKTYKHG